MNKEEYELLNKAVNMAGDPAYMGYRKLIESLRTVARAADATSDSGVGRLWERRADEYERYNVGGEEMRRMRQALDALPQWVLLDSEDESE